MRFPLYSLLVVTALAGLASASTASASMVYSEPTLGSRTDAFALKIGASSWGVVVLDGYRTLDGKDFYSDSFPSRQNGASDGPSTVVGSYNESQQTGFSSSSEFGKGGSDTVVGNGAKGFGLAFDSGGGGGSSPAFGSGGGSTSKVSDPLLFAYTADLAGLQGLGDPGGAGKGDVSTTPLPSTWSMFLIGLGVFGFGFGVQRSRRQRDPLAVA